MYKIAGLGVSVNIVPTLSSLTESVRTYNKVSVLRISLASLVVNCVEIYMIITIASMLR